MLEVIADLILKFAKRISIDETEAFLQKKNLKLVQISKGLIKKVSEIEKSGVAVRSIIDKKIGFVATNSSSNIENTVELSAQNARNSIQNITQSFVDKKSITRVEGIRDNQLRDLELEDMSIRILEIVKSLEESKPLKKIDGSVLIETEERLIVNSSGLWKREVNTKMQAQIETVIEIDEYLVIGSGLLHTHNLTNNWQDLFNTAIKTAYSQQGRTKLAIDKPKAVVFSPKAMGQIIAYSLIPSFYITNEGHYLQSITKYKFSPDIEMIDDPTFPNAQNTFGFDDEGYPTKPRVIYNNGQCKQLLGMNFTCAEYDPRIIYLGN
ncbi:MAG: metallopeptidase TldD-related protein, partial [Candidatus Thorarchaeota archaeon]